ncbi:TonB-dependent receptor domain-containing protein [Govanella unica]|uniref:TonB-dependent receptor n=1 Tax=Govanella unica TaxID=2975056 RepID=A0A9X3Z7N7_9PROT|nr:TonB-dependent receptor [Govania unica]MDA5194430.1 TonB-dependent receptor [Govania unica]
MFASKAARRKNHLIYSVCSFAFSAVLMIPAQAADYNISPQNLDAALNELARQGNLQLVFDPSAVRDLQSPGVQGDLDPAQAVRQVLAGTDLTYTYNGKDAIVIRKKEAATTSKDQRPQSDGRDLRSATVAEYQKTDDGLTEIVVTATRQAVSVNKVPISITAITQEGMDIRGLKQIDDIARITPGINFERNSFAGLGNRTQISIRGIESQVGASTTGIYIDETPIQTRNAGYTSTSVFPAVFDLARVEVLRGPQGTLFGSGSEGGTIRFITPEPDLNTYSGYGRAEIASTKHGNASYEAGAAVGGPIVDDRVGFRVSAFYRRDGGWIDRVNRLTGAVVDDRQNSKQSVVMRAALTFAPNDNLRITPSIYFQDLHSDGGDAYWEQLSDASTGRFRSGNALAAPSSDKFFLPALKINYDFGSFELVSNTSYLDRDAKAYPDYTQFVRSVTTGQSYPLIPGEYSKGYFLDKQKGLTEEIRLQSTNSEARLNWVVGVFYNRTRQLDLEVIESPFFPQIVFDTFGMDYIDIFGTPLGAMDSVYTDEQKTVDKQIAAFGQVDYSITDKLKATVGLRYAKVDFSFKSRNEGSFAGVGLNSGQQSEKPLTPKFGLSYQVDPGNMIYASAAKGFRPGGAQRTPPSSCAADLAALNITRPPDTYKADSVWSYEVGAKNRLFGDHVQLNTSAFWIDWSSIQQLVLLTNCGQSFVGNLGKAVSKGFDLALDIRASDSLMLSISGGYTNAEYKKTIMSGPSVIALKGNAISQISPWVASFSAQYDFSVVGHDAYVRGNYDYRSKGPKPNPAVFGVDPMLFQRPQTHFISARAGVEFGNANLSLFVDNLLDADKQLSRSRDTTVSTLITGTTFRPRTIGLTLSYRQ